MRTWRAIWPRPKRRTGLTGEHAQAHLADYAGIFQADAFGGYNRLYEADRKPGQIVEAACWVHARRPGLLLRAAALHAGPTATERADRSPPDNRSGRRACR